MASGRRSQITALSSGAGARAIELFPIPECGLITFGGLETMTALVEARLAYVNGLYFCTILSALAVLERHFAGMSMRRALNRQNG